MNLLVDWKIWVTGTLLTIVQSISLYLRVLQIHFFLKEGQCLPGREIQCAGRHVVVSRASRSCATEVPICKIFTSTQHTFAITIYVFQLLHGLHPNLFTEWDKAQIGVHESVHLFIYDAGDKEDNIFCDGTPLTTSSCVRMLDIYVDLHDCEDVADAVLIVKISIG